MKLYNDSQGPIFLQHPGIAPVTIFPTSQRRGQIAGEAGESVVLNDAQIEAFSSPQKDVSGKERPSELEYFAKRGLRWEI